MYLLIVLLLNILLGGVGLAIILTKKSTLFIIIGLELILQAAISNFIIFDSQHLIQIQGQVVIIFSTAILICEITLLIAMLLRVYQHYKTSDFHKLD